MTGWLIDTSALVRLGDADREHRDWPSLIQRGLVSITTITLLEVGFTARNEKDLALTMSTPPVASMPLVTLTPRAEERACAVQRLLWGRGHHRAVSIPDLLVAAMAELEGLTVLHVDKDFDLIADVTGQPVERLRESP